MKKSFSSFVLIFLTSFSLGQITYQSSDFTEAGASFDVVNITGMEDAGFAQTGENFSWDFSGLATGSPESYGYIDPSDSPYKNTWCLYHFYFVNCDSMFDSNFNLGLMPAGDITIGEYVLSDPYQHLFKSSSDLQMKMYGASIDLGGSTLPAILEYNDPDVLMKFPIQYGDAYNDTNGIDMDFGAVGVDLTVTSTGTRTNTVEGWGQLSIPNHAFGNVLKVKSVLNQEFSINYEGQQSDVPVSSTTYYWFDKDYGIPVLTVSGIEGDGVFVPATATYLYFEGLATHDVATNKLLIVPNPTNGKFTIQLKPGETLKKVRVYDMQGKLVGKKADLSGLPAGTYMVKIETSKGNYSQKIIRK